MNATSRAGFAAQANERVEAVNESRMTGAKLAAKLAETQAAAAERRVEYLDGRAKVARGSTTPRAAPRSPPRSPEEIQDKLQGATARREAAVTARVDKARKVVNKARTVVRSKQLEDTTMSQYLKEYSSCKMSKATDRRKRFLQDRTNTAGRPHPRREGWVSGGDDLESKGSDADGIQGLVVRGHGINSPARPTTA